MQECVKKFDIWIKIKIFSFKEIHLYVLSTIVTNFVLPISWHTEMTVWHNFHISKALFESKDIITDR